MTLTANLTQTVTVSTPTEGAADDYGVPAVTWSSGTDYLARLEQTAGTEATTDRDVQSSDWLLILPADAVITGSDRVEADGVTYEVVGPPVQQRTPRGVHHVEARLRVVAA